MLRAIRQWLTNPPRTTGWDAFTPEQRAIIRAAAARNHEAATSLTKLIR